MISVAEARARILATARLTAAEWISLDRAAGRALAEPLVARHSHPPADVSAMDGYAVRAADIASLPARLTLIGTAAAGHGFAGRLGAGGAVRIFTGAPVPAGADTVVIQENADAEGKAVIIREPARQGLHIRKAGSDFFKDAMLLKPGSRLTAPALALAAGAGHAALTVRRAPRMAILATGDELVRPGEPMGEDQIVSSNGIGLAALARAAGAEPFDLGIAPDRSDAIAASIRAAKGCDVLVTIGGASVGDHDLVRPTLEAEGVVIDFWKIAMRPGKPLMFGRHPDGMLVLGLPGNPVSSLVCGLLYLRPLLLALQGLPPDLPEATAILGTPLPANDKRADYLRATLTRGADGTLTVHPFAAQDSAMLHVLTTSDALIVRPPQAPAAPAAAPATVIPLAGLW